MKIRTRLAIAFVTITVVPIVLIFVAAFGLVNYQEHLFQKTYGLSEQIDLLSGNQTQVFNRLTQGIQEEIREAVGENTDLFEEPAYLSKVTKNCAINIRIWSSARARTSHSAEARMDASSATAGAVR